MKNTFIYFLLLMPFIAFCQEKDTTGPKLYAIGIRYSPDYCYRQLAFDKANQWSEAERNETELPKYGFTAGVTIQRKLTSRFSLAAGVSYSDKGEKTKIIHLNWATPNDNLPAKTKTIFQFQYIELPITLNYCLLAGKINIYAAAGFSFNMFINRRTLLKTYYPGGYISKQAASQKPGYANVYLSAHMGMGISYALTKRILVSLEPLYRQGITSLLADTANKEYLYSFGMNAGVCVLLNK